MYTRDMEFKYEDGTVVSEDVYVDRMEDAYESIGVNAKEMRIKLDAEYWVLDDVYRKENGITIVGD